MGSIVMEPEDVVAYMNGETGHNAFKNFSTICTFANRIHCSGVFNGANPLEFSVSLLLFQLGICSGTIILFSQLLKPLGLPLIVSQILGGLVLGSSGLSHLEKFKEKVFPLRGFVCLDVVSALGHIFYFFLIGLQTDISILKEIDIKAFGIGSCSTIFAMLLISTYSLFLSNIVDVKKIQHIFEFASLESFISYPMVVSLLYELHLINSKFGRISLSASMASSLLKICLTILAAIRSTNGETKDLVSTKIFSIVVLILLIIYVIRPATLWMAKENPIGQPLKEYFVITLLLGVLVVAFCCQTFGLRIYFGSFLLGFIIPSDPPIGSTLVDRLEFITSWIFMPIFFVRIGLVIDNIYTITLVNLLSMSFIIFISALGKFLGSLIISMYYKFPMRDAISLGLILNSQGALELSMFKIMKKDKLIDDEAFVVGCISIMVIVAIITPIIRYLLRPSKRYIVHKRRTVMHSRPEFDLCVLVCIHDQEDVPSVINLLDALNPTRRSHLIVYMLHLVELLGRAQPKLIHHKHKMVRSLRSSSSKPIVNAFKYFEDSKSNIVAINLFTAISPSTTMHDDVCSLALDKSTSLILAPFHKRYHSNGMVSFSKHKLKIVNHHILDKAPCSVGLIVERGLLRVSKSIETNLQSFQIVVIFIGGPDDREAMFIGARMVGHVNINLTMIRLLDNENVPKDDFKEKRLDDEAVAEFRQIIANNYRVRYKEEVVKDGTETISILRSMGSNFDLIMVGRRHSPFLSPVQGLVLWDERTELGAIGEVLASSDFMGNATILVVQQHTKVANEDHENPPETIPMDDTKKKMTQNHPKS
ncbi:cation/H(+) antiporter 15-like [Cucumis melo var. makuwa]|uniref:Cation/H(+) antiporter 15-like n=1 Tax=Cucumis melo var. makuwa TaxID=1194695 RepID=A0A5D3DF05_CUCMM|nr:cation/H(+) antiporter 15-like [Cucumis melo var. makuwa]TYK22038.1 cation/H(+) antiporter 15-like [Cucumis melo var. makuwa]